MAADLFVAAAAAALKNTAVNCHVTFGYHADPKCGAAGWTLGGGVGGGEVINGSNDRGWVGWPK